MSVLCKFTVYGVRFSLLRQKFVLDWSVPVISVSTRHGFGSVSGSAWIRINLSCWIRIQVGKNDPQK
jgi:hypothetical protein